MTDPYVKLSSIEVGIAVLLILVNGLISIALKLRMERTLLIAAFRTVIQLLLIGFILEWIFSFSRWYAVLGMLVVMTAVAGITAVGRADRRFPGIYVNSIVSVWISSWLMTAFALLAVMSDVTPWYHPQYAIPLAGMILGNSLNGISLGLNQLGRELATERERVEALLSLGATRWEAARDVVRSAVRTGMIPIVNSMMIVGLVSLPGMMTGQLLAGVEPIQAVQYQIVIMFLIASGTALGTVSAVLLSYRRLFNAEHQFESWKLTESANLRR